MFHRSPPTEELSDPYIDNYIAAQQLPHSEWPGTGTGLKNVLMAITRTRNHNVVVYRANMVSETQWDMQDPIDVSPFLHSFLLMRDNKSPVLCWQLQCGVIIRAKSCVVADVLV